jgi:hypothetical protein
MKSVFHHKVQRHEAAQRMPVQEKGDLREEDVGAVDQELELVLEQLGRSVAALAI